MDVAQFLCSSCGKWFKTCYTLKRHIKNTHKHQADDMMKKLHENGKTYKFNCNMCHSRYNKKSNFNFHLRKVHKLQTDTRKNKSTVICPLCSEHFPSTPDLIGHLNSNHDISISTEAKSFPTFELFSEWKLSFEAETRSHFVTLRTNHKKSRKIITYACHRSGIYIPQGKGLRHLKAQGSLKINGTCPAGMRVTVNSDGRCEISITKTHVGHQTDIEHLHLSVPQKKLLATKIASKVPFDVILDEVKDSVSDSDLLTKEIRSRHKTSQNLDVEILETDKGWDVLSTSEGNFDIYHITEGNPNCSCRLICAECNGVCIHHYSCTCIDASIKWNMCEHVHFLCRYLLQKLPAVDNPQEQVLSPDSPGSLNSSVDAIVDNMKFETESILIEFIKPETNTSVFEQQKQDLIATFVNKIQNINSSSELDLVERWLQEFPQF